MAKLQSNGLRNLKSGDWRGRVIYITHIRLWWCVEPKTEEEYHETLPPAWVPPELIRAWDAASPEVRKVMKEELEKRVAAE